MRETAVRRNNAGLAVCFLSHATSFEPPQGHWAKAETPFATTEVCEADRYAAGSSDRVADRPATADRAPAGRPGPHGRYGYVAYHLRPRLALAMRESPPDGLLTTRLAT